uniref:Uncharacterized protein n=1 Tax=Parascaris univalens TaxID=6257 RepID=A0A915BAG1_PARUN
SISCFRRSAKMQLFLDKDIDPRLVLILSMLLIFNAIPLLAFIAYLFLSGVVIFGAALFAELITMLFGLAILLPVLFFCSIFAVSASAFIIAISAFYDAHVSRRVTKVE